MRPSATAVHARSDGEGAEGAVAEVVRVNTLLPGVAVREELPKKARAVERATRDGHRASIRLQEEVRAIPSFRFRLEVEAKDLVRDHADLVSLALMPDINRPL